MERCRFCGRETDSPVYMRFGSTSATHLGPVCAQDGCASGPGYPPDLDRIREETMHMGPLDDAEV